MDDTSSEQPIEEVKFTLKKTENFDKWFRKLKDQTAKGLITLRLERIIKQGLFGDVEPIGNGISELRIFYGAGYRIYFIQQTDTIIVLLCGGDKSS